MLQTFINFAKLVRVCPAAVGSLTRRFEFVLYWINSIPWSVIILITRETTRTAGGDLVRRANHGNSVNAILTPAGSRGSSR